MSIRKSETIEGYRGRPEDDSSVQRRGKSTPPRSGPQQRARWDIRIPAGGSTSSLLQKTVKSNYVPVVSSPLKTDGNGSDHSEESSSGDVLPGVRPRRSRRSLQIRVIEPPLVTREPALLELSSDDALAEDLGYEWPTQTLEVKQTSSLQSLGRGFSRYPSQKKSESTMGSSVPSSSRTPPGLPIDTGYRHAGHGFNTADPERGFVPYIHRRDLAVCYPGIGEKEDDDSLHNPEDDRGPNWRDYRKNCGWRLCFTTISFLLLVTGPAILFIVWPILSYSAVGRKDSPEEPPETLTNFTYPIVGAIRTSMIDPDTPEYALTRKSALGTGDLKLVFSDEFNQDGRAFYEGDDQFWQAADFHYAATNDLEWYDPDAVTTKDGTLQIRIDAFRNHNLDYRSGMLQSWNKLCFKGGVLEISASLAGPAGTPGLWPGIWTLGNLARPGFQATSDGVWPYSYDQCDVGITPNQSSFDGISFLPGQKLASCTCIGEDHPTPGIGRGAPEIDALEGTAEYKLRVGVVTQSSQVAPFDIWYMADPEFIAIRDLEITQLNGWRGGPFQQAISGVTMLNNDWYDGKQFQKYSFEYIPGQEDGAIVWFVGDDETFRMSGKATGPNGNIGQRDVSREPMSIVLNLGISTSWTWIDWNKLGPRLAKGSTMFIDYVRIYQEEGNRMITCDPPGYYTTDYIRDHPKAYYNSNLTNWDSTGYPWPKNKIMYNCD